MHTDYSPRNHARRSDIILACLFSAGFQELSGDEDLLVELKSVSSLSSNDCTAMKSRGILIFRRLVLDELYKFVFIIIIIVMV